MSVFSKSSHDLESLRGGGGMPAVSRSCEEWWWNCCYYLQYMMTKSDGNILGSKEEETEDEEELGYATVENSGFLSLRSLLPLPPFVTPALLACCVVVRWKREK